VLEAICGRDILPRGSGIVTRRPLILQLNSTKPGQSVRDKEGKEYLEWGEFQHTGDKKFIKYEEITKEIVDETDRVTGGTMNVSSVPIGLRLYSPSFIPLTLVDLPGLVKNALPGQPPDIDVQIASCVNTYIARPNAIILAVSAANADLATSDAISAAARVDPNGDRTVGVLTKVDIVDKGTEVNVVKILNNEDYKLKLGWIAVQNRSQRDIDANKPINKHLKDEMNFFLTHEWYKPMASRLGVQYLTRRLNQVLINHIQVTLPDIKMKIQSQLDKFQKELITYG
jgi:replication fork clamp-binding protein CrfC